MDINSTIFSLLLVQNSFIRVQVFPHLLSNLCADRVENKFLSTKHLKREKGVISVKKRKKEKKKSKLLGIFVGFPSNAYREETVQTTVRLYDWILLVYIKKLI